jgi:outer membrane lipoprotein carrier protein
LSPCAGAESVEEKVVGIQQAYEKISDIRGAFIQKSYIKDLRRTDTFKGKFFIKRPRKLKWNYQGENAQDILINNDQLLIYQKKEKQAIKGKFNRDTYGQAPIALLSGFGRIQEEFVVSEKNGRLLLKPKKPMGGILSIEILTADGDFPIHSFTIYDSLSNRIEIVLKDVTINSGLEDSFFELAIPPNTSVLEHNL